MNTNRLWADRGTLWRLAIYTLVLLWVFSTAWTIGWLVSDGSSPTPAPVVEHHG